LWLVTGVQTCALPISMSHGGILNVFTRLTDEAGRVQIGVRDNGTGISPELLPKIFEPFVTTKDRTHGTGLGLAVSRSIIERHSGKISVQSELGKGTTFTITLPVVPTPQPMAVAGSTATTVLAR